MKIEIELACKLASVVVHAQEMLSSDGHNFDSVALKQLLADCKIKEWIESLGPLAPKMRRAQK